MAFADVNASGTVVPDSLRGVVVVTHTQTGIYCITAPGGKNLQAVLGTVGDADTIFVSQTGLTDCPPTANFGVQTGGGAGATITNADNNFAILVN